MFDVIAANLPIPQWGMRWPRFKELRTLQYLLDGEFYDHLVWPFYVETEGSGRKIDLVQKRPSIRYPLLRETAAKMARKLWAGGHFPNLTHKNQAVTDAAVSLIDEGQLGAVMLKATIRASIGACAVSWRFNTDGGKGGDKRVSFDVWWPHDCDPIFDTFKELVRLRVRYVTSASQLRALGFTTDYQGNQLSNSQRYWYVQDMGRLQHVTYFPVSEHDWNPTRPDSPYLKPINDRVWSPVHNLGFVPARWLTTMADGDFPDGRCFWRDAIPNAVNLDYTLSMIGRGLWYNAGPQMVVKGELKNIEATPSGINVKSGPAYVLQVDYDRKNGDGSAEDGADVKLLEMDGGWLGHAVEWVKQVRQLTLEGIQATRKDVDNVNGNMSGRAMQFLEDDTVDLQSEIRTVIGDHGFVPMLLDVMRTAKKVGHPAVSGVRPADLAATSKNRLRAQWPSPFQPDPDDLLSYSQALQIASALMFVDLPTAASMWQNYADVPQNFAKPMFGGKQPTMDDVQKSLALIHGQPPEKGESDKGGGGGKK